MWVIDGDTGRKGDAFGQISIKDFGTQSSITVAPREETVTTSGECQIELTARHSGCTEPKYGTPRGRCDLCLAYAKPDEKSKSRDGPKLAAGSPALRVLRWFSSRTTAFNAEQAHDHAALVNLKRRSRGMTCTCGGRGGPVALVALISDCIRTEFDMAIGIHFPSGLSHPVSKRRLSVVKTRYGSGHGPWTILSVDLVSQSG
nr:hypothetical protein CFP56_50915 [Quercus suber]